MKKTLIIFNLLALVLFLSLFMYSCGDEDVSSEVSSVETQESSQQAELSSEEELSTQETSEEPSSEEPSSEEPSSEEPSSEEPSSVEPSSVEPSSEEPSSVEPSSVEPSSEEPSSVEPSSVEPSSEEPSSEESSEESSQEPVLPVATPVVFGCTKVETGHFVLLGTCEDGAVLTAVFGSKTITATSDHGYFSLRIPYSSLPLTVKITASVEGKQDSAVLSYKAQPKTVSSGNATWGPIVGSDYQFHITYTLNDYLRNNLYSTSKLNDLTQMIKNRINNLDKAEIIYVIAPNPNTVYPETMPDSYVQNGTVSRLDQVSAALKAAGATVFDMREIFASHKYDDLKIYWKTDSHWTDYGAFLAYTEVFNHISKKFPAAKPRTFSEFNWIEKYYIGGDCSHYLEYYDVSKIVNNTYPYEAPMKEWNVLRKPKFSMPGSITSIQRYVSDDIPTYKQGVMENSFTIRTNRSTLPNVLVLRDSYSAQMFDILAERCNTVIYQGMWDFTFKNNTVRSENIDYVIYILVERNLDAVFK